MKIQSSLHKHRNTKSSRGFSVPNTMMGFTLMELLIGMMIVAIVAALAYPAYTKHIVTTQRTAATSSLMDIAARQEHYFFDNKRYAGDLQVLAYSDDPVAYVAMNGDQTNNAKGIYKVGVAPPTDGCPVSTCYLLKAEPQQNQVKDSECGSFILKSTGERNTTGTRSESCW